MAIVKWSTSSSRCWPTGCCRRSRLPERSYPREYLISSC
jgi:hypothetical protein